MTCSELWLKQMNVFRTKNSLSKIEPAACMQLLPHKKKIQGSNPGRSLEVWTLELNKEYEEKRT